MITVTKQLTLFLDNRPGVLARMCEGLAAKDVNILALDIVDSIDHAIVRMVVDKLEAAEQVLLKLHQQVHAHDVLMMDVPNTKGALAKIAERLAAAGINIEYAYCTVEPSQSVGALILRTNDFEATINALS